MGAGASVDEVKKHPEAEAALKRVDALEKQVAELTVALQAKDSAPPPAAPAAAADAGAGSAGDDAAPGAGHDAAIAKQLGIQVIDHSGANSDGEGDRLSGRSSPAVDRLRAEARTPRTLSVEGRPDPEAHAKLEKNVAAVIEIYDPEKKGYLDRANTFKFAEDTLEKMAEDDHPVDPISHGPELEALFEAFASNGNKMATDDLVQFMVRVIEDV